MTAPHTQSQPEAAPVRQRTATPWRVHGLYPEEIYATVDGNRMQVAEISGACSSDQDVINAAFIVEAVNSHATLKEQVAWWEEQTRQQLSHLEDAKGYVERAIASYVGDPADNQFQKGFLAALEVVRDEAFSTGSMVPLEDRK